MNNNINNSEISVIKKEKKTERFFLFYSTLSTFLNLFNQYFKERIDTDEVARSFINKIDNYFNVKYIFKNNGFDINHKKSIIIQQHYAAADAAIALLNFPETKFAYYYKFHNIPILGDILDSLEYQPVGQIKDKKNSSVGAHGLVECAKNALNGDSPFAFFPEGQCNSILNPNIRCQTGGLFGIFGNYFQNDSVFNQANIPIIISNVGLFLYGKSRPVRFSNEINEIIKNKNLESEIVAKLDQEKGIVFLNQSFELAFKDEMKINEYDINKNIFLNEILNLTGIKFDNSNQLDDFLKKISDEKGVLDFEKFNLNIKGKLNEFLKNKIEILESKLAEEKKFKDKSSKFIDMIGYEINFFKNLFEISNKDSKMTIIKDKSLRSFFDQFNAIINIFKEKNFNHLNFDEKKFFCHKMIELIFRLNNKLIIKSINNDIDLKNQLNNSYSNIIFGFEKEEPSLKLSLGNFNEVAFNKLETEKLNFFL